MRHQQTRWKNLLRMLVWLFIPWAVIEEGLVIVATLTLNTTVISLIAAMFTAFFLWGVLVAALLTILPDQNEKRSNDERG